MICLFLFRIFILRVSYCYSSKILVSYCVKKIFYTQTFVYQPISMVLCKVLHFMKHNET